MKNIGLWRQVANDVSKGVGTRKTSIAGLNTKEFNDGEQKVVAIEQNPRTQSQWASLARQGHKVVQFKDAATNKYVGVSVDGKVKKY